MNRLSCYFERISDFAVGLFLLFTGLALTLISFTIIPAYRYPGSGPGRCFFRRQKKQGMCVGRATNKKYFFVLKGEIVHI